MRFQEISQAYAVLGSPELRKKYDDGGNDALKEMDLNEVQVCVTRANPLRALSLLASSFVMLYETRSVQSITIATEYSSSFANEGRCS